MTYNKVCRHCNSDFVTDNHRISYCSEDCRYKQKLIDVREFAKKNEDRVTKYKTKYYEKNKEIISKQHFETYSTLDGYCKKLTNRAKKNQNSGITKELIKELILSNNERCAITGVPFQYENKYDCFHNPLAPSIDRIDSRKPYHKDNIQIVLTCINKMKGDLPNEDFLNVLEVIKNG